jgi:transposase
LTLHNGRYRRPRLFVMTLRYSRRSFRKVVWTSSTETWSRLHEEAFRYFGGAVRYIVLDNLKEGVIKPDIFEPELNRVYAEMLRHYSAVADAARVRDPNRKGTVESAIQHTQATALKGRRFESIEAQNDYLAHWETNWARTWHCPRGSDRALARACVHLSMIHFSVAFAPGSPRIVLASSLNGSTVTVAD